MGPDLSLLPVHFLVDPGPNYSWSENKGNGTNKLQYSFEDKLNVMKQYLDVEKLLATNLDYDSDSDKKSSGSYESDDNLGCIGKEKKKDGKVKDQFHSVTKQFGSLGKSMTKKLKKNFGSVGKALKSMGPDQKGVSSIGSGLTQSTRVPLTIAAMNEQEQMFVWCAKLSTRRSDLHKDMIQNYMKDAKDRFLVDKEVRTARGEEIRRKSMEILPQDLQRSKCMTASCDMYGNPETHYLCSKCFNEQKKQALDQEKYKGNTLPGGKMQKSEYDGRGKKVENETVQKYGKSKFYIESDDESDKAANTVIKPASIDKKGGKSLIDDRGEKTDATPILRPKSENLHVASVHGKENMLLDVRDSRLSGRIQGGNIRDRTPSPDYDNVDYGPYKRTAAPPSPKMFPPKTTPAPQSPQLRQKPVQALSNRTSAPAAVERGAPARACRTPGCAFYGSPEQQDFCSSCYKRSKQHHTGPSQLTRL